MTVQESSSEHWDEAEFRAVFLQHYARIVAILVRLLGDRSHAEEVATDTLWRLYRKPALQVDDNVGGWCRSPGSPV
jgi:DNA-directed RNA polymerase specialized sigma24 family protein